MKYYNKHYSEQASFTLIKNNVKLSIIANRLFKLFKKFERKKESCDFA